MRDSRSNCRPSIARRVTNPRQFSSFARTLRSIAFASILAGAFSAETRGL
jgi:hypothetical protein